MLRRRDFSPADADTVWHALGDPTRRTILDLLREGPKTVGQITDHFPTSRFAVRKHLNLLEAAHLVIVRWQGRERWNHLNVAPLQLVYERWVTPYQRIWAGRLTNLKRRLEGDTTMPATPQTSTLERVEIEIDIAAPPAAVWDALTKETTLWWPTDFYTGPATGFHMEPRIGGRLFEDWGDGAGVIWYEIFALNPGVSIDLQGSMGVPYGPAISLLHLELEARGDATRLKVSDATFGAGADCAAKESGWRRVFAEGLKRHVENRR
ncbi:MAG TPA: metalloregulator ArsR/SmtB family transcription factor [Vicinamibacterales bacterium]|nr:metalloregulator ArsR/SmtB family transcription factor [Vicinamibacterales bacterium]